MRLKSVGLVCTGMPLAVLGGTFGGGTFGGGTFGGGTFGGEGLAGRGLEIGERPVAGGLLGAGNGGGEVGGPKRSLGMLPRLGGRTRLWEIARATEPRGVPFAGAAEPAAEELPWPLPFPETSLRSPTSCLEESPFPETCP